MTTQTRRDRAGVTVAVVFLTIAAALTIPAVWIGGWALLALIPAAPFAFFGVVGLILDAVPRPRDCDGRVVLGSGRNAT